MRSSSWIRPIASSSAALASIGALIVAVPLTAPGSGIARSVISPAYELLSHNDNDNDNDNDADGNDDVHTNGTHVDDVHTNGTHVDDVTAISDSSGGKFTGYVAGSRTRNQTLAQPRGKRKSSSTTADPITSGSYTAGPAVPVAVTVSSAKPAKSAEKESSSSVNRASESSHDNGTSTRSKLRSTRSSAARR